ncbi:hypothetical protein MTo_03008 [Microcystis aeruginosa NIES-1211]|jgi:uncharacterized protein|uniref:TPM domain-containing protein n=1 Tax=Microcystis TaxID=1125 RepID=UPI000D7BF062|nr:TPM domain-containing protein [Microcystis aeruginosa]GBL15693.1 hypothetical protein MTo_03008 [Microcystis aeruginosa NIES-1211]
MIKIRPLPLGIFLVTMFALPPVILPPLVNAIPIEQIPTLNPQGGLWVSDRANLLSRAAVTQISGDIAKLEVETGAEIAVVTVPDTLPYPTPKAYATALFNRWKIGKKSQDNGVLILVSPKDRRIEIETGYGVQRFLPDAQVKDIIYTYMIPSFKTGNYEEGIRAGVTVVSGFLRGAYGLRQTEFRPQTEFKPQTEFNPQIAMSTRYLVLAILIVGVFFPSMLILCLVCFRCAVGGNGRGGRGGGSNGNSDYCGYDGGGYGGGGYDGGDFGGGSSDGGGGGDW